MHDRFAATATASAVLALAAVTFAATGARSCVAPHSPSLLAPAPTAAPWTLTAGDGSGLRLVRVDAKGVVEGPLAFTELHLYFHNPEARVREGTFAITLPPGATLSRFAMEHEGGFHEGDLERGAGAVAAGLGEAVLVDVELDVPGATWVSPRRLPAVRAGGAPAVRR